MTAPSEGIKTVLLNASPAVGVFGTPTTTQIKSGTWGVFVSKQPDDQNGLDRCVTIYDTGGLDSNPRWLLDYPTIQVMVRGKPGEYQETYAKALEVKNLLLGLPSQNIGDVRWVQVNIRGDIGFIGYDSSRRPEFSVNFQLILEPDPTANSNREPL